MNSLSYNLAKYSRQRGAAGVAIAMLIMFILVAAVLAVQNISGTSVTDAVKNDKQVTALFLAESGLERTTAIMTKAAASSGLTWDACTAMASGPYSLGTGRSFNIDSATMYDSVGAPTTSCIGNQCAKCVVQVTGCVYQGTSCVADAQKTTRTLQQAVGMQVSNGSCGFGGKEPSPVSLSLSNPTTSYALGFFTIGWAINQNTAPPGFTTVSGNTDASCNVGSCLSWLISSSSGGVATGNLGAIVTGIAPGASSDSIEMPITQNRSYSAVGILFEPRFGWGINVSPQPVKPLATPPATPTVSSFWDDKNGSGTVTINNSATLLNTGLVNSGVATSGGTCDPPPTTTLGPGFNGSNPSASCTNWCYGGDTIVMGLSGKSNAIGTATNVIGTNVTFNSVGMKRVVHLPVAAGDCPSYTPPDEYTEIHYLYNPDYISTANTASSGGVFNGVVGIPSVSFSAKITYAATNKLTVNSIGGGYKLFIGDQIYCDSNSGGCDNTSKNKVIATISDYPSSSSCTGSTTGCDLTGASNTYTVAMTPIGTSNFAGNTNTTLQVNSQYMQTTQAGTRNWLSAGDVFTVGSGGSARNRTIVTAAAAPCSPPSGFDTCNIGGVYKIREYPFNPIDPPVSDQFSQNNLVANGYTIHVDGGLKSTGSDTLPLTVGAPEGGTVIAVKNNGGSGALPVLSCVVSNPAPDPTVFQIGTLVNGTPNACNDSLKQAAATRLVTATVCGGTCGLFNDPDSTTGTTPFVVTRSNGDTTQWAAGLTCIKGIDPGKSPTIVTTSSTRSSKWSEVVR